MNNNRKLSAMNRKFLPPGGLFLSLLVQVPAVLWRWPLRPARAAMLWGMGMLVVGVVLNLWADRLFAKSKVGVRPFSPVPSLVSEGPYRFTRNPMYLGMVLICAGTALMTGLYFNLCAAAVLAVWLHLQFVLPEEEFLQKQLGLVYLSYASRSPRWLGLPGPRLARLDSGSTTVHGPYGGVAD